MAALKTRQLRAMQEGDLAKELSDAKTELTKERGHIASGTRPENPGRIGALRRTVARILTLNREKELGINQKTQKQEVRKKK